MLSWKTLWKSERIHRLLICCLFFTLKPLSGLPPLLLQLYACAHLRKPHSEIPEARERVVKRSGHGRWDGGDSWLSSIYAQWETTSPLQTGSTRLKEWRHLLSHQCLESIRAGPAPPEAISEYSQHFRVCGLWTNYTPSLLSTINHTRIVAFMNTGQEARIELLGWYQTNTRKILPTALKVDNLFSIELSIPLLISCF